MPHNVPFSQLPASQPALIIIKEEDRVLDGNYEIAGEQILSFEFDVPVDGQIKINSRQFSELRQSLSIRAWVSIIPNSLEVFGHFHPGDGGIHHLLVDETLTPVPVPEVFQIQRNQFSEISYAVGEVLIRLPAGRYYYNVRNMEGHINGFKINLAIVVC